MKIKSLLFLSFVLFCGLNTVKAQATEESLKSFLSELYAAKANQLSAGGVHVDEFLENYEQGFSGQVVRVEYDGRVEIVPQTIVELRRALSEFANMGSDVKVKFNLNTFNSLTVKNKVGVATFEVGYEVTKGGQALSKGTELYSITARMYSDGNWRVSYVNRIEVEAERFVGDCICEVFDKGNTYVAILTVPDGDNVETVNQRVEVITTPDRRAMKVNGDDLFEWDKETGEVKKDGKVLGKSQVAKIALIDVMKYYYPERCQNIRIE